MAHSSSRAQPALMIDGSAHQLIGMKCTLHQRSDAAAFGELHRPKSGRVTVWRGNYFHAINVELAQASCCPNLVLGADKYRNDQAPARRLASTCERKRIDRVYHRR